MEEIQLLEIYNLFGNSRDGPISRSALGKLQEWGLIPQEGVLKCKKGHDLRLSPYSNIDGWMWRCQKVYRGRQRGSCDVKRSIRTGTFFERSQLSMCKIVVFCFMWVRRGGLLRDIWKETKINKRTAVDWSNFCREVVVYSSFQRELEIGGPGTIVEIDESKIGKRKYHRGHRVEGQCVFGGIERGSNKCFIVPVEDRSKETLLPLIKRYIRPGTLIVSDCWKAYRTLNKEGYIHRTVNHSLHFVDPKTGWHTNGIEGLWRHLKVSLSAYNRRKIFFNGYVQRFIFFRWCKANKKDPLLEFFRFAGQLYNPANLTADSEREEFRVGSSETPMILEVEVGSNERECSETDFSTDSSESSQWNPPPAKKRRT
ncbi:uncharacterized protein [Musca autumnalis]|uniref:uncharacterized protein n=1 Tax=Musca autumnalis TaxID=221902 RepID=UPI003CF487FD